MTKLQRAAGSVFVGAAFVLASSAIIDGAMRNWSACMIEACVSSLSWSWGWALLG